MKNDVEEQNSNVSWYFYIIKKSNIFCSSCISVKLSLQKIIKIKETEPSGLLLQVIAQTCLFVMLITKPWVKYDFLTRVKMINAMIYKAIAFMV